MIEGGCKKVSFQGPFERGCGLDVTDFTGKPVPVRWASK